MTHRAGRVHVVELLDAGPGEPAPSVLPAPPDPPGRRGRRRWTWRRHGVIATAAVVVLVAGAVAAGARDRSPGGLMSDRPGGLVTMPREPVEAWRHPVGSSAVAALGDTLVVVSDRLTGRDPATGAVRWQTSVWPGVTTCEPVPFPDAQPADTLVCVSGPAATDTVDPAPSAHEVRVVGKGGAVLAERTVTDELVEPLPGGRVLRGSLGPDAVDLTAEDARTGAVRWQHEEPRSTGATPGYDEDGDVYTPPFSAWTWDGVTRVQADGVEVTLDADGDEVRGTAPASARVALPGGATARTVSGDTLVSGASGAARWRQEGTLLAPAVTDGTPEQVLVLTGDRNTRGVDARTGETLWTLDRSYGSALGRVGDTVLLSDYVGVSAVDVATGRVLWTKAGLPGGPGVLSDGTRVVLATPSDDGGTQDLVAVRIADGATSWTYDPRRSMYGAFAIDGRLVAFEADENGTVLVGLE